MSQSEPPRRRWTGAAVALVVIGLLFLVPSGLCTGFFGIMAVVGAFQQPENSSFSELGPVLGIGAPFILVGIVLLRVGLRARKPK
jgi:hypothetical protein